MYYTNWTNRTVTQNDFDSFTGDDGLIVIYGMDSRHSGIELELNYQPINLLRLDAVLSYGGWEQTNDPNADYKDYANGLDSTLTIYIDGVKVGDQPQQSLILGATLMPMQGMSLQVLWKYYDNYYANWQATQRTNASDKGQSWKTPSYSTIDLHFNWALPYKLSGVSFQVFAHVFNLLDALYIQDATDNSKYNGIRGAATHSAQRAEVFFGAPRSFNAGVSIAFN